MGDTIVSLSLLTDGRYHLSRFPNLQHFEIHIKACFEEDNILFPVLNQTLPMSSPTSHIKTLSIEITWICDEDGEPGQAKDLLSPDNIGRNCLVHIPNLGNDLSVQAIRASDRGCKTVKILKIN